MQNLSKLHFNQFLSIKIFFLIFELIFLKLIKYLIYYFAKLEIVS